MSTLTAYFNGCIKMKPRPLNAAVFVSSLLFCSGATAEGVFQIGLGQDLLDQEATLDQGYGIDSQSSSVFTDILTAGEVINISLCGSENADALSVEVFAPSNDTTPVFTESLASGNIDCDHTMDVPLTNPIRVTTAEAGAYRIVLQNDSHTGFANSRFRRYDFTVTPDALTNPDPTEAAGRLWAYTFGINSGTHNTLNFSEEASTDANFFALIPGGSPQTNYVWQLDLNNFSGFGYNLVANSIGVDAPNSGYSVPADGNSVSYEHPLYVGYPAVSDPRPTSPPQISDVAFLDSAGEDYGISPGHTVGVQDEGAFQFRSDIAGTYYIQIDLNSDGVYGNAGDRTLIGDAVGGNVLNVIAWDGMDAAGDPPAPGTYFSQVRIHIGEYHFIANDVETSGGGELGLTVHLANPDGSTTPTEVYWDDITLLPGAGGTSNTPNGALSDTPEGRHTWGSFTSTGFGNERYIDTYVYGLSDIFYAPTAIVTSETTITNYNGSITGDAVSVPGGDFIVTVTDQDNNVDPAVVDTSESVVINSRTGESDVFTLTETGPNTNTFTGLVSTLDSAVLGQDDDGTIHTTASDVLTVRYIDLAGADFLSHFRDYTNTVLLDTDSDLIANVDDLDDDGDGITDLLEGSIDTDGDGVINSLDTDSDNDGILDEEEGAVDTDSDGLPNFLDPDSDNDGVIDLLENLGDVPTDLDSDGIPNYLDADSDNDGINDSEEDVSSPVLTGSDTDNDGIDDALDVDELGGPDLNSNGIADSVEPTDTDGDGVADIFSLDSDGDGVLDALEGNLDSDGDGVADRVDLDSDNDGISDSNEDGQTPALSGIDVDGNGIDDAVDAAVTGGPDENSNGVDDTMEPTDSDNDGVFDHLDVDSDNDGIIDRIERDIDFDLDGVDDRIDLDSDNDGIPDAVEAGILPVLSGNDLDADGIDDVLDVDIVGGLDIDSNGIADALQPTDSDADGIPDYQELDSDNDSIPDVLEQDVDTDNDGIPNYLDSDSDNDGIADADESAADTDNDGTADYLDTDSDNDSIPDAVEGTVDSDNDGIIDALDADSDDDGILDSEETLMDSDSDSIPNYLDADSDNDGIADTDESAADTDGDGIADFLDTDSDNDNIPDAIEAIGGGVGPGAGIDGDADADGVPNTIDDDSDGDGIADALEGALDPDDDGIPNYLDLDSDGDGISDEQEAGDISSPVDTDNDGVLDFLDLDSDNDALPDVQEAGGVDNDGDGLLDSLIDTNGDGIEDSVNVDAGNSIDTDLDGTPDYIDTDSDNDGVNDIQGTTTPDVDDDGQVDVLVDTDGDGLHDVVESSSVNQPDTDNDGIPDATDPDADNDGLLNTEESIGDSDGDGVLDYLDLDSDNDGIPDAQEGSVDSDGDGIIDSADTDSDGDGILDSVEATPDVGGSVLTDGSGLADTDGDSIPDYLDEDSDGDGISDEIETSVDTDGDGLANSRDLDSDSDGESDSSEGSNDSDGDGVIDSIDSENNLVEPLPEPTVPVVPVEPVEPVEPVDEQADLDGDGTPDSFDSDIDGDGIPNVQETANGSDADGDGIPNERDLDSDNDGIPDAIEGFVDSDADGVIDSIDLDSDNDGLTDAFESGFGDNDGDGHIDVFTDTNGDGLTDSLGTSPEEIALIGFIDTDSDGILDFIDLDSDNDGLPDGLEADDSFIDENFDGRVDNIVDLNVDGLSDELITVPVAAEDTDGDGVFDHLDLDSDNDGVFDVIEAGGIDNDNDGVHDGINDTDGDGVPDTVDVDFTNGTDQDGDGIDDTFDADFVTLASDSDKDGVIDAADPDVDGDGYLHSIIDVGDGELVIAAALPDVDGNGVPDIEDISTNGEWQTAVGCSVSSSDSEKDPLFPFMLLVSLVLMFTRRARSRGFRLMVAFATLGLVSACSSVPGQSSPGSLEKHVYAGVGVGASNLAPEPVSVPNGSVESSGGAGVQLTLGMDLHPWVSGELHATQLGSAELNPSGQVDYQTFGASALIYAGQKRDQWKRPGFNAYLRLGAAGINTSASDDVNLAQQNSVSMAVGVGAEYATRFGLGVRGDYILYSEDAKLAQLGLVYRFGKRERSVPIASTKTQPVVNPQPEPQPVKAPTPVLVAPVVAVAVEKTPVDADADGVLDAVDQCLSTSKNALVNAKGCAYLEGSLRGAVFTTNNSGLTGSAEGRLLEVVTVLKRYPNQPFQIAAHTDNVGSVEENLALSKARAIAVARFIRDQGIAGSRFRIKAFGEANPIASNATEQGRAQNRRVELVMLKQ